MKFISLLFFICINSVFYAQENPVLVVSSGHHQSLNCVDISPDGKFVASGGTDNLVKLYDMRMQQELNTFTGHSYAIVSVEFSTDGRYLISSSKKELLVHTHPEGRLVSRIEINRTSSSFTYHVTKDMHIYLSHDDGLQLYNGLTGELKKTYPDIKKDGFVILPDEKTLIITTYEVAKPGVGFYSLPEGIRTDFIPVEGMYNSRYTSSLDGKTVAFEAKGCEVAILDVKTKTISPERLVAGVGLLNVLQISPNGKQIITSTFDNYVHFWDINTGKKVKSIKDLSPVDGDAMSMSMNIKDMDYSDDGKMAVFCYNDLIKGRQYYTVEWFNSKTMESIGKHAGEVKIALSISVDASGKILSTGTINDAMGVKCIDLAKGSQKAFIPGTAYHGSGGKYLAASSDFNKEQPKLDIYRMPAVRLIKSFDLYGFGNIGMSPSGRYATAIDAKSAPNPDPMKAQVVPFARVWDIESGKEVVHLEKTLQTMPRECVFTKDETKVLLIHPEQIETVDLTTGKVVNSANASVNIAYNIVLSPDGNEIMGASYNDGVHGINHSTGETITHLEFPALTLPVSLNFSPDNKFLAVSVIRLTEDKPNRIQVYNWESKELICELIGHTSTVRQMVFGPDGTRLYSADDNGVIAAWNLTDCELDASFLAFGEEDYLIISPKGYYKTSKGNIANIGFRQQGSLFTFDQFDLRYNRPDKVLESIGMASEKQVEMYTKAYKKRLKRMGFDEENFSINVHAPEIEIVNPEQLPLNTNANSIDLNIKASDASVTLDRLVVSVNGTPIYGKLGKTLKGSKQQSYEGKVNIPLVVGVNKIQLSVMNADGTESVRRTYSIDCKKKIEKPDLYIIAFGVRKYSDSSMNLTYSDKDAKDLVELFQKNEGASGIYNKVHVQMLTNNDVLKEKVAETRSMLTNSKVDDQVALFYSGHGLLDEELDYFLSTHDVDFASPSSRGLPFDEFKDLIDGIPARNRLILVDACHSGEIDKDEVEHPTESNSEENIALKSKGFAAKGKKVVGLGNSFELMKELFVELRKESGATIIASSAGKEFSLESADWKNGVFTFSLKEGLLERKADTNQDQKITVSELKRYLFVRVKELSDGKQTPTVRRENLQHDYVIY